MTWWWRNLFFSCARFSEKLNENGRLWSSLLIKNTIHCADSIMSACHSILQLNSIFYTLPLEFTSWRHHLCLWSTMHILALYWCWRSKWNHSQKIITKCDGIMTNCDSLVYYKARWTSQIATAFLLQSATRFITNCDRYYKVRWLLQIATVHLVVTGEAVILGDIRNTMQLLCTLHSVNGIN